MTSKRLLYAVPLAATIATIGLALISTAHAAATALPGDVSSQPGGSRGICYHTDPSDYHCPDSTAAFLVDASDIAKITMTIAEKSGKSKTVELPSGTDAVFFSSNSVKGFLIRYYRDTRQTKKLNALTAYLKSHSTAAK